MLHDLSPEEFGKIVGISKFGIVDYESGFIDIYYEQAVQFAKALGTEPNTFMDEYTLFCMPGYGKRIRKIRDMYGVSQQTFSDMIGCERSNEAIWEAEFRSIHPQRSMYQAIKALAESIGMEMQKLIDNPDQYVDEYAAFVDHDCDKKIKYLRALYGVKQEEFGRLAGCQDGSSAVSLWEHGITKPLRKNYIGIKKLAEQKGLSIDLLNEDPEFYKDAYFKFIEQDCGKKVRYLRLLYGVHQEELAAMIGCRGNTVSEWEAGNYLPTRQSFAGIERLALEKGIDLDAWHDNPDLYRDDFTEFLNSDTVKILKTIRSAYQMSQEQFCTLIGVSRTCYHSWENPHKKRFPSRKHFEIIKALALEKGIDIHDA